MALLKQSKERKEGEIKRAGFSQATFLALGGVCIVGLLYTKRDFILNEESVKKTKELAAKSLKDKSTLIVFASLSFWYKAIYENYISNSIMDRAIFATLMTSYQAILSYGLSKATNIPLKYTIWTGYLSFPLWLTREAFGLSKTPSDDEVVYKIFKTIWWDYSQLYLMNAVSSFSFNSDLNYGFFPPSLDIINDHIALGRCPVSREVDIFKDEPYNIIGIINMCRETKGPIDKYKEYGIECHNFPTLDDTEPKESDVDKAVELIDKLIEDKNNDESKNGKRILVHCAFGRGRSTTIVLCHLIKSTGMSIKQAFEFVQSKRKWASHSVIEYNVVNAYGLKYSNKH